MTRPPHEIAAARLRRAAARIFGRLALGAWAVGIVVIGAFLMAGHLVSLPTPSLANASTNRRLEATLAARPAADQGRWSATHVLYQACGCSTRVLAHLVDRRARPDLIETVVYVHEGDPEGASLLATDAEKIRGAGFRFEPLTPVELEQRYEVEAAPMLVVADPQGHVRYAAGYTDRSGAKQIDDVTIVDHLRSGQAVRPLPVFGCAVSHRVQEAIDPLGLKYRGGTKE